MHALCRGMNTSENGRSKGQSSLTVLLLNELRDGVELDV